MMRREQDSVAPVLEAAWVDSAYLCTPSSLVDDRAGWWGAQWLLRPHIRPTLGEKLGWSVFESRRLELVLEKSIEFRTHEKVFNKQTDVGGKMSKVKRHDQVPECGQNQSDCRGECPRMRMQAGPGTGKG